MYKKLNNPEDYPDIVEIDNVLCRKKKTSLQTTEVFSHELPSLLLSYLSRFHGVLDYEIIPTIRYVNDVQPNYVSLTTDVKTSSVKAFASSLEFDVNYTVSSHACVKIVSTKLGLNHFIDIECVDLVLLFNLVGLKTLYSCGQAGGPTKTIEITLKNFSDKPNIIILYDSLTKNKLVTSVLHEYVAVVQIAHENYKHKLKRILEDFDRLRMLWD